MKKVILLLLTMVGWISAFADSDPVTMSYADGVSTLSNGLLTVTITDKGKISSIVTADGKTVMSSTSSDERAYFNFTYRMSASGSATTNEPTGKSREVITQTADMVDILYTMDSQGRSNQLWKVGYVMRRGVSGLYAYAIVEGNSSYSELHEARIGWRVNATNFTDAWVSDTQKATMPTPSAMKTYTEEVQDATYKLKDGSVYTKYDWANFVKDDLLHGAMGSELGAWLISPSAEWVNGGAQKQELTLHATDTTPIILQTMHSLHYGAGAGTFGSGEQKLFGPCLFYVNSGASQDAMVSDAKQRAAEEAAAWPYSWFTNSLIEQSRSTVTGQIKLPSSFVTTTKIRVVLAKGGKKPLLQGNGYQFWAETDGSGNFTIGKVRPGTYTLYAYALNGEATGMLEQENVTVTAGTTALGAIEWNPVKYGTTLWRIGEADRTTAGFSLSSSQRRYGLWESIPAGDKVYTVGSSDASAFYYAQVTNNETWSVKFNNTKTFTEPLHLTIATAGAANGAKVEVKMNNTTLQSIGYSNDAAIYRSGVLAGRDSLVVLEVPASAMKIGENTLNLKTWNISGVGGVMYDCIKLEGSGSAVMTFDELTAGTYAWDDSGASPYAAEVNGSDYSFVYGQPKNSCQIVVNSLATPISAKVGGYDFTASKSLTLATTTVVDYDTNSQRLAGDGTMANATFRGSLAFNTTEDKGTVFIYAKGTSDASKLIFQAKRRDGSNYTFNDYNLVTENIGTTAQVFSFPVSVKNTNGVKGSTILIRGQVEVYAMVFVPALETFKFSNDGDDMSVYSQNKGSLPQLVAADAKGNDVMDRIFSYLTVTSSNTDVVTVNSSKKLEWGTESGTAEITAALTGCPGYTDQTLTLNVEVMDATVEIGGTGYATFGNTLDYSLSIPSGLRAYGVSGFTEESVTFTEYTGAIPEKTGVILVGSKNTSYTMSKTNANATYAATDNYLVAVEEAKVVPTREGVYANYIFANGTSGVGFYRSSGVGEIAVGKAYLHIEDLSADYRSWTFRKLGAENGSTTASDMDADSNWSKNSSNEYWYKTTYAEAELTANGNKVAEAEGLRFISTNTWGIGARTNWATGDGWNYIALSSTNGAKMIIPDIKANHTVTFLSRSSSGNSDGQMTCTDTGNVVEEIQKNENDITSIFTIKTAGTYTFEPKVASQRIYTITIEPVSGTPAATRGFYGLDDLTSGIREVAGETSSHGDNDWFTMQGIRVEKPGKGLYIHNGKKVFIK